MRILLVDDDPIMQRAATRMLPRFDVDTAGTARDALFAAKQTEYDAVVIDACLGSFADRAGIDLAAELRAGGYDGGILLVSGVVKDLDEEARRIGADAALLKGEFGGSELRTAIERAVAGRKRGTPAETGTLPKGLHVLAEDVLDAFAKERALQADLAYRLALLAQGAAASTAASTGSSVFEACARAVGLSRQTLQPYATVAARWSGPELRRLLAERRNANGEPISISHLVELARIPSPARDEWLERVYAEALTVRQLRELLRSQGGG